MVWFNTSKVGGEYKSQEVRDDPPPVQNKPETETSLTNQTEPAAPKLDERLHHPLFTNPSFCKAPVSTEVYKIETKEELQEAIECAGPDAYVVVMFSTTGCPPCQIELPFFEEQAANPAESLKDKKIIYLYTSVEDLAFAPGIKTGNAAEIKLPDVEGFPSFVIFHNNQAQQAYMNRNLAEEIPIFGKDVPERVAIYKDKLASKDIEVRAEGVMGLIWMTTSLPPEDVAVVAEHARTILTTADPNSAAYYRTDEFYPTLLAKMTPGERAKEMDAIHETLSKPNIPPTGRVALLNGISELAGCENSPVNMAVADLVQSYFTHEEPSVRTTAIKTFQSLSKFLFEKDPAKLKSGITSMFDVLASDTEPIEVKTAAAKSLRIAVLFPNDKDISAKIPILMDCLYEANADLHAAAIDALARANALLTPEQTNTLISAMRLGLTSDDPDIRLMSVRAVKFLYDAGKLSDDSVMQCWKGVARLALKGFLGEGIEPTAQERYDAMNTLSSIMPRLKELFGPDYRKIFMPLLTESATKDNLWVRPLAQKALDILTEKTPPSTPDKQ